MASNSATQSTGVGSSNAATVVSILQTKRNPEVWENFDLCKMSDGSTKARCKKCGQLMGKESNTTLKNHTKTYCASLKSIPEEGQSSMGVDGNIFNYSVERTREALARFVIQDALPFNHFDNSRLTKVIQENLQPRYRQVSRTTLKNDCMKMWKNAKQELVTLFQNLDTSVNLTTDIWSAPHGLPASYLCVTAHWIDPSSWQIMKRTIAFENFDTAHTGQNLFYMLKSVMSYFKIEEKVFSISFDNASNNTNAVQKLILKYKPACDGAFYHGRCVAHILNLVVQSGLGVDDIAKLKTDFRKMLQDVFYGGATRYKNYMRLCKETDSVFLTPNWDCPTRWNSTLNMFECALRQHETLKVFHDNLVDKGRVNGKFDGWKMIEKLVNLLQVFKDATNVVSGVYYPTSQLVLNQIWLICMKLDEYEVVSDEFFRDMVVAMKTKLKKYFKEMPPIFSCAAALNPCLNVSGVELLLEKISDDLGLWEEDINFSARLKADFNRQFQLLFGVYNRKYGASASSSSSSFFPSTQSRNPKINLYNMVMEENTKRARTSGSGSTNSEYANYTTSNFVVNMGYDEFENFDILAWWKAKEGQFPILARMARDILSAQASTVASESAFSTSGRVLSIRRTRLTPASLEMCICLKDHFDAMERVQHKSRLEDPIAFEEDIHNEEVLEGNSISLSDEEIALDEAMRSNSSSDEDQ